VFSDPPRCCRDRRCHPLEWSLTSLTWSKKKQLPKQTQCKLLCF
jgi:hypothetical protein